MNIEESLNKVINEAVELPFWVRTDMNDKENVEFTKGLWNCFVNHCQELGFTLGRTHDNQATFEKTENTNHKHFISFDTQTNEIAYDVLSDGVHLPVKTFRLITDCTAVDKAFEEIKARFEGLE